MRAFARHLVHHAAAVISPVSPIQARAMVAELDHVDSPNDALDFALGCVFAAYRQRLSIVAAVAFAARLGTSLAAGLFGLLHIAQPWSNVALKLELLSEPGYIACGEGCESWVRVVGALPLTHWLWQQIAMATFGTLHFAAAIQLLRGSLQRLAGTSAIIAAFALAMPVVGGGGITFPAIYILLIGTMLAFAHGLSRLEHWSFARRAIAWPIDP